MDIYIHVYTHIHAYIYLSKCRPIVFSVAIMLPVCIMYMISGLITLYWIALEGALSGKEQFSLS